MAKMQVVVRFDPRQKIQLCRLVGHECVLVKKQTFSLMLRMIEELDSAKSISESYLRHFYGLLLAMMPRKEAIARARKLGFVLAADYLKKRKDKKKRK